MNKSTVEAAQNKIEEEKLVTYCVAVLSKAQIKSPDLYERMALYWLNLPVNLSLTANQIEAVLVDVLCDPLQEELWIVKSPNRDSWIRNWRDKGYRYWAEKQFLPGVTDNLAHTVAEALKLLNLPECQVASGTGYLFEQANIEHSGANSAEAIFESAKFKLYHPVIERFSVHDLGIDRHECEAFKESDFFSFPSVALPVAPPVESISLEISDQELIQLSRKRLLVLSLSEMRAIRDYFRQPAVAIERQAKGLTNDPTDVELEVIAQTWSEHCKHKIFNATIVYNHSSDDGSQSETLRIKSLYKTFIQAPTKELAKERKDLLSVFKDNSGVVAWDDQNAVCFKVETHNSPSALEPYGGALTGILGVNRDILGTGLGAKPLFNTDVFCFAYPSDDLVHRPKLLPASLILNGVRKGVEDGGNKSGIPTINGSIHFDPGYRAKPLVFCGTGGMLPLSIGKRVAFEKYTKAFDSIVMAGGRVGADGVHGATFSSESLNEGSPVSAVQIGDPFTQKRLIDFVLEARDAGLITGITDNGAGGLSSSVGEMAQLTNGATLNLDAVPTKYPGLADWEIVVSESQERMTLSTDNLNSLTALAARHGVEVSAIGEFDQSGYFTIERNKKIVCLLSLEFLHEGCPTLELPAEWSRPKLDFKESAPCEQLLAPLLALLSHPNISNREEVIRQYDHEVQGTSVIKPLMGAHQNAPCDAAVIAPVYGASSGLVVSNGLAPRLSRYDTYLMAVCSVDEAIRNAICVGCDPSSLSLLDNFCWPDPITSERNPLGSYKLGQLVRACQGLAQAVMAFEAPLISGKDSMKNDFDDGVVRLSIPPTLLISLIGKIDDVATSISMEFKNAGDLIYLIRAGELGLAASHYEELLGLSESTMPSLDLAAAPKLYRSLHKAIKSGLVQSAHDLSEGGLACAIAECLIASGFGASIQIEPLLSPSKALKQVNKEKTSKELALFGEGPGHILVSIAPHCKEAWEQAMDGSSSILIGQVSAVPVLEVFVSEDKSQQAILQADLSTLSDAWNTKLPFD
jgi:phosphoribosylformylglycinamidine synthase